MFIVRHTAVIEWQDAEFAIDHVMGKTARAAVWNLVSSCEEAPHAITDMMSYGFVSVGA